MPRLLLTIRGRVQGVGFRWFVRETAESMSVAGWVRNREDGSVEAEVQGDRDLLARFVDAIRTRHPFARVEDITTREIAEGKTAPGFDIR
ncbi:MAG: acylphosphatase [Elusimicrobia bacterium]|nr:acylphosphatase [Elusimicrobiota bacterium]